MSLPAYADGVMSGIEWLGSLPRHWKVTRLKRVCKVFPSNIDKKSYEGDPPVHLCNYTDVYYNDRITADLPFMSATATEDQIERFTLRAGDIIITKDSETADDIAIPAYVPHDLPGVVCGYHLSMLRPLPGTHGAFIKWLFDSKFVKASVQVRANGLTRVGLGQYALDNLELPFPPLSEQAAIAAFLDRETGKIDALVEEQKRLIKLLKEKRQAVISHAVTKSLNPDAPMKDSGIEWLGQVPAHWKLKCLKYLGEAIIGLTYSPDEVTDEGNGVLVLRSSNVLNDKISLVDNVFVSAEIPNDLKTRCGDILICSRNGSRALIGKNAVINAEHEGMTFGAFMTIFRSRYSLFLRWVFKSRLFEAQAGAFMSSTINQLTSTTLCSMEIALPPEVEQHAISAYLERITSEIGGLIDEADKTVGLLAERRAALISAAVTGKIDVREIAAAE